MDVQIEEDPGKIEDVMRTPWHQECHVENAFQRIAAVEAKEP